MPSAMERAHVRPRRLRKMRHQEEVLKLRRAGMSYRAIGAQVGLSAQQCKRLCDQAYTDYVAAVNGQAGIALGEELDRLDGLIRAASAIMASPKTSPGEKMRALEAVRRCSETKVRWLGVGAPDRVEVSGLTRADLADSEVANLDGDALDRELEALGWAKTDVAADEQAAAALNAGT